MRLEDMISSEQSVLYFQVQVTNFTWPTEGSTLPLSHNRTFKEIISIRSLAYIAEALQRLSQQKYRTALFRAIHYTWHL